MQLITALATPFFDGKIDLNSYTKLLVKQQYADALLCCGTTGEGALLSDCEKKLLLHTTKAIFPNKQLWVGISCGATSAAVKEAIAAENWGAQGLLICPPAFFKCTEMGFIKHICEISRSVSIPIMLYNAPTRCGYTLWKSALDILSQKGVEHIKDAGTDLCYTKEICSKMQVYCGNDELLRQCIDVGCQGVVSVVSNIAPKLTKSLLESYAQNKIPPKQQNVTLFEKLSKLAFTQLNPITIKYLLYKAEIFRSAEVRLPLTEADQQTRAIVDNFWQTATENGTIDLIA